MAAPRKPKSAGVRTAKSKAQPATSSAPMTAAVAPVANGNVTAPPSAETIRLRAYERYLARNGTAGDEVSDWLAAEREILEEFAPHAAHD